jgi:hypothetical protein
MCSALGVSFNRQRITVWEGADVDQIKDAKVIFGSSCALDLLSVLPDGAAAGHVASRDWQRAIDSARRHGFASYLGYALSSAKVSSPPEAMRELERCRRGSVAGSLRVHRTLALALRALAEAEVPVIPLKGWTLSRRLYPDPSLRTMSDVDLLIRPEDQEAVLGALTAAGARFSQAEAPPFPPHRAHLPPLFGIGGARIELHLRAIGDYGAVVRAAPLFERANAIDLDGLPAWALCDDDLVLYLAAHAVGHAFERLSWLLDLKLLLLQASVDWDRVSRDARGYGLSSALDWTRAMLARIDAPPIPLGPVRGLARLLGSAESAIEGAWFSKTMLRRNLVRATIADSPWRAMEHALHRAGERARSAARRRREVAL